MRSRFWIYILCSLVVSCGGGSGSSEHSGGSGNSGNSNIMFETPLTEKYILAPVEGLTVVFETGYDGNIRHIISQSGYISEDYTLTLGIPSLNITEINKITVAEFNCPTKWEQFSYSEQAIYDYQNKKVYMKLKTVNKTYECSFGWGVARRNLPTTVTNSSSINSLLNDSDISSKDISSTCPEEVHNYMRHRSALCSGYYVENIKIIDNRNKVHKISYIVTTERSLYP